MAGRGAQTFKKRQKEQQRKERQEEKRAKRLERKNSPDGEATSPSDDPHQDPDIAFDLQVALPPGATRSWTE